MYKWQCWENGENVDMEWNDTIWLLLLLPLLAVMMREHTVSLLTRQETLCFLYKISGLEYVIYKVASIRLYTHRWIYFSRQHFTLLSVFVFSVLLCLLSSCIDPCASWLRVQRLKDKLYNTRDDCNIDDKYIQHASMRAKSWAKQFLQHLINLLIDAIFSRTKKYVTAVIAIFVWFRCSHYY